MIKSPEEVPPNEQSGSQRPGNKTRSVDPQRILEPTTRSETPEYVGLGKKTLARAGAIEKIRLQLP